METIEKLLKKEPVYLNVWDSKIAVISDFDNIYMSKSEYLAESSPYSNVSLWEEKKEIMKTAIKRWEPINILFASYGYENYSGDAWVLFEKEGKLYEVKGGHCSCYGLEGQWEPEEVNLDELQQRLTKGTFGEDDYSGNTFKSQLMSFLGLTDN